MTQFSFMLFPDGSWCDLASATDYLKETGSWLEVTGETTQRNTKQYHRCLLTKNHQKKRTKRFNKNIHMPHGIWI